MTTTDDTVPDNRFMVALSVGAAFGQGWVGYARPTTASTENGHLPPRVGPPSLRARRRRYGTGRHECG
jgi:hypothetical protein